MAPKPIRAGHGRAEGELALLFGWKPGSYLLEFVTQPRAVRHTKGTGCLIMAGTTETLALYGGPKAVQTDPGDIFEWPIVTEEDEQAILDVLHRRAMSGTDVTKQFEEEFAAWQGTEYALGFSTGTAAIQAAMFGCGVGVGDEIICQSLTYWASCLQVYSLGGTVVFAEVDPDTLCIDPGDIEHRITDRTKAIVVVHYLGHPADMDPIMEIARAHDLKVIEDVSHAQGGLYKGRMLGTIGDVGAMSLMSGKSLAVGEAGILVTDDLEIYERGIALGHYGRFGADIQTESLRPHVSSAMGRVQLKHYDERCVEIRRAMNYFWDLLEDVPGIKAHRPSADSGSTMAGWYAARGLYRPEEIGGLFLPGGLRRGCVMQPGREQALAPAPVVQHHRCLRPRQADAHRQLRPGPAPAAGQSTGDREYTCALLLDPVVQAL